MIVFPLLFWILFLSLLLASFWIMGCPVGHAILVICGIIFIYIFFLNY